MAKIIKLGELLPEDFRIETPEGKSFLLPGDPPLSLVLRIAELFERAQNSDDGDEAVGLEIMRALDEEMLRLLQMRDETIKASPFGVLGVQHVVAAVLSAYNFGAEEVPADEEENPPKRASRSKRSTGSRPS